MYRSIAGGSTHCHGRGECDFCPARRAAADVEGLGDGRLEFGLDQGDRQDVANCGAGSLEIRAVEDKLERVHVL